MSSLSISSALDFSLYSKPFLSVQSSPQQTKVFPLQFHPFRWLWLIQRNQKRTRGISGTKSEYLIGFPACFSGFRVIMAWCWRRNGADLARFVTLCLSLLGTSNWSALSHLRNSLALFCSSIFFSFARLDLILNLSCRTVELSWVWFSFFFQHYWIWFGT